MLPDVLGQSKAWLVVVSNKREESGFLYSSISIILTVNQQNVIYVKFT